MPQDLMGMKTSLLYQEVRRVKNDMLNKQISPKIFSVANYIEIHFIL